MDLGGERYTEANNHGAKCFNIYRTLSDSNCKFVVYYRKTIVNKICLTSPIYN